MGYTQMSNDVFISLIPAVTNENDRAIQQDRIVDAGQINGLINGNASGNIPINNGVLNVNLNAEKLGGNLPSAFATAGHTHTVATSSSNGLMANTDKTKLDTIATSAEVNQMAFSNILVGGVTIQADSKTDTLELVAGANITLTPDATNDKVTVSLSGTVPTATSAGTCTGNSATATTAGTCTGNSATATTLQTARTINGVSFNGSANIAVEPYIEQDTTTNANRYLTFTDSSTAGYQRLNLDTALTYNPSTNLLATSITGNSATATNATTAGGLAVNSTGVNNLANQIVRTDVNGYIKAGYINTNAPDTATASTSYFVENNGDGYIRPKSLANVKAEILSGVTLGNTVSVLSGTIANGGTIPLPSGYTHAQCKWIVSMNSFNISSPDNNDFSGYTCLVNATTRVVTCTFSYGYGTTESYDIATVGATANYIIIGVK